MKEYVWDMDIEWAHCDAAGIVFYPYFYMWFDQATGRLFSANKLSYPELKRDFEIVGMPLLETGTTYQRACALGDKVTMTSSVEEWKGKTFLVRHKMVHDDGTPAFEGFERRVMVVAAPDTPKGIKAIEIPDDIKSRFTD